MLTVVFGAFTISRTQVQLWYNRFKEERDDVNAVLVAWERQQPIKTLKQWVKWFWIIAESLLEKLLMMLAYRSAHVKQFLRTFQAWNLRQRRLFQNYYILSKNNFTWLSPRRGWRRSRFAQKSPNWWRIDTVNISNVLAYLIWFLVSNGSRVAILSE